jgi:hypothetical protein
MKNRVAQGLALLPVLPFYLDIQFIKPGKPATCLPASVSNLMQPAPPGGAENTPCASSSLRFFCYCCS